jgi:Stress responsive A/B Barrel Domain
MATRQRDNTTQPRVARQSSPGAVWAYCLVACLVLGIPAYAAADAIEHIVIVWLREPGNTEQRARIISESQVLRQIPGVTGLRAGDMLPSRRSIVDSSFDVALVVSLRDTAAMKDYLSHPLHVKLVEETLKPLVKKIQVYDFTLAAD